MVLLGASIEIKYTQEKPVDQKTKTILIKMLGMTTSSHDGEALVAIRKANALLVENNLNWDQLLSSVSQTVSRSSYATPPSRRKSNMAKEPPSWDDINSRARDDQHTDADEIDKLFEAAYDNTPPGSSFYGFIESVHTFWSQRSYLTPAQYQAIRRAAR